MVRVEGREGRQPNYAIAVGSHPIQPLSTEETYSIQSFLWSRIQKRPWKRECFRQTHDVYDNILEDFADILFKLSDRLGQHLKDLDGEEESEHEYDPKKEFDSKEEFN